MSHEAIEILEQLMQGLAGTITAWERFQESDLAYFDLDNEVSATRVKNIETSIQELRVLEKTLKTQIEILISSTTRVSIFLTVPR